MAISKVGKINSANVDRLSKRFVRDKNARAEAATLMRRNFHKFVETVFDLTEGQRAEMQRGMPKSLADVIGRACAVVVENRGRLEYRVERVKRDPDLKVELYHKDDEWGIRIIWEK